jgi:hypothetical protein
MMKTILAIAIAVMLTPALAQAGVQAMVPCPALPAGCIVTCVQLDTQASVFGTAFKPLQIEMLDTNGEVLGTATLHTLTAGQTRANLDTRVSADDIDSIRFYTADGSGMHIGWIMLKALCDPCECACWNTVYKGCLCDWRATVEPVMEVIPEPVVIEEIVEVPMPPVEIIKVPGRG